MQEHLRQARLTFNLSIVVIALSLGISVTGAIMLLKGNTSEGTINTASGLLSTTLCTQVTRYASDRLDRLTQDLKRLQQGEE